MGPELDTGISAKRSYRIPRHMVVAGSAWASRIVTTLVSLYSVRLLTEGLGVQHYAIYTLLVGLTAWFMLADMGMSVSLQNYISEARAKQHSYDEYIAVSCFFVGLIGMSFIGLYYVLGSMFGTALLNKFGFLSAAEKSSDFITTATISVGICFGSLVYRIWYAEQKGYWANFLPAVAALAGLASIFLISKSDLSNKLLWYLIGGNIWFAAFPVGALVLKLVRIVDIQAMIQRDVFIALFKRAWHFWLFTVVAVTVLQVDYIILSQFVKPKEIVIYSITMKLFTLVGFLYGSVLQAFWPTCAEWAVGKEWAKIQSFVVKYVLFAMTCVAAFTGIAILFRVQLLRFFMPSGGIALPATFIALVGVSFLARAWTDVFAIVLQSMNDMRVLLFWAVIQAAINLTLQFLLAPKFGIYGVVLGLMASFLLTVTWALPKRVRILRLSSEILE